MKVSVLLVLILSLVSCSRDHAIVIGSKNFTEQLILGELAAQQIERKLHVKVQRRLGLGGTLLAHEALVSGDIDLYPEYTGTAVTAVLKMKSAPEPAAAYLQVKDAYLDRFHLVWLPPLGFNDTFAMAVRREDAAKLAQPTLSAASARPWRLGVGYEFVTRPDGLPALDRTYGMHWQGNLKTMDLGLLYAALGSGQVDMVAGNSTDGLLADEKLTVLEDDRRAFPPYNACYVVRQGVLNDRPALRDALTLLSSHVTEEHMRSLNRQVDLQHRPITQVVREYLATLP